MTDCTCYTGTGLGCPAHDPRYGQPEAEQDAIIAARRAASAGRRHPAETTMTDHQDIEIMLARAANITERTLDRFASEHWGPTEIDYARKLIADLAAVVAVLATPSEENT
jgi:hypothetical protein